MDAQATSGQLWPLKTGSTDNPSLTAGQPVTFFMNDIPAQAPTGPLAYYLPYILLTISGNLVQAGGTGSAITWERLINVLLDSLEVSNTWFGSPVAPQFVKGIHYHIIEPTLSGWNRKAIRQRNRFPAANGTYPFDYTIAINLASCRLGRLGRDTSQLALLFRPGKLTVNVAAAATLTNISAGATFTSLAAKASAVLLPRQELVLGTPVETVLHQPVSGSGPAVLINGFGRDTQLTGVKNKGGVLYLSELTSLVGQNGVFQANAVTNFSFPWRGQQQHSHVVAMAASMLAQRPNARPTLSTGTSEGTTDRTNDMADSPYLQGSLDTAVANLDLVNLAALEFVTPGDDVQLTDLQTADSDQQYNMTVTGGFTNGNHQILGMYAKAWADAKIADWMALVNGSGLAQAVLGKQITTADLTRRVPRTKHSISPDQFDYLPWQAIPA
jgi:hypothetical protein